MTGPDSEGLQAEAHERDVEPAIVSAMHRVVDCRSSAGEAMAMIDAAIHCLRVASRGDTGDPVVIEALRDLVADPEVGKLLSCKLALPSSPVVPAVGAVPVEEGSALARMLETYLTTRGHTLSTAHLTGMEQMLAEAEYVLGEAQELRDAVVAMTEAHERGEATSEHLRAIRHEVADVALADTTFASLMPGSVTVELCIAEKTEADRGRG